MLNILVLEDQSIVREVISEIISNLGVPVHVAQADGIKAARAMLDSHPWNVLVADFQLGDGLSLDLVAELREQGNTIPVVLVSGFLTPDRVKQAEGLGITQILAKPFEPEGLLAALREVLAPWVNGPLAPAAESQGPVMHGRLLPELFEMDRHLGLLFRMFSEIPRHQDVAEVCSSALSLGMEMARAKRGFIALYERNRKKLVMVAMKAGQGSDPLHLAMPSCHLHETPFASLLSGEDEVLQLLEQQGQRHTCWPGVQAEHVAAVPVRLQAVPMGVMCLIGCEGGSLLNDQVRYMLRLLVTQLDTLLDNRAVHAALADSMKETLVALVRSLEARDRYTKNHSSRVSELSVRFATDLGLGEDVVSLVRLGGLLHDIGKVGIPDEVLLKPGRYSDREYAIMKAHPAIGDSILKHMDTMVHERLIVRHHHERWDGRGYPDGLMGEEIPLEARIVCVADAIDAMTTHRVYRQAKPLSFCIEQLKLGVGTQFDPQVVEVAINAIEQGFVSTQARPEDDDKNDEALTVSAGLL